MDIINNVILQLQQQANQILGQFRQLRGNISIQIQLSPIDRKSVDEVNRSIKDLIGILQIMSKMNN